MILDTFSVSPGTLVTNGAGEQVIIIGGRLRSLGLAPGSPDGNYSGTMTLTVDF